MDTYLPSRLPALDDEELVRGLVGLNLAEYVEES